MDRVAKAPAVAELVLEYGAPRYVGARRLGVHCRRSESDARRAARAHPRRAARSRPFRAAALAGRGRRAGPARNPATVLPRRRIRRATEESRTRVRRDGAAR